MESRVPIWTSVELQLQSAISCAQIRSVPISVPAEPGFDINRVFWEVNAIILMNVDRAFYISALILLIVWTQLVSYSFILILIFKYMVFEKTFK